MSGKSRGGQAEGMVNTNTQKQDRVWCITRNSADGDSSVVREKNWGRKQDGVKEKAGRKSRTADNRKCITERGAS